MWLCLCPPRPFEDTFENSVLRTNEKMKAIWLCGCQVKQFDLRRGTHSGKKLFKCNQYVYASVHPGNLSGHLKTHSRHTSATTVSLLFDYSRYRDQNLQDRYWDLDQFFLERDWDFFCLKKFRDRLWGFIFNQNFRDHGAIDCCHHISLQRYYQSSANLLRSYNLLRSSILRL